MIDTLQITWFTRSGGDMEAIVEYELCPGDTYPGILGLHDLNGRCIDTTKKEDQRLQDLIIEHLDKKNRDTPTTRSRGWGTSHDD